MQKVWDISLDGDTFEAFKSDFNHMVESTINTMQQKGVGKAVITAKMEIEFPEGISSEDNFVLFPMFKHKVSAQMQFKDERSGFFGGANYKLVWNPRARQWEMRDIDEDQETLFDE